MASGRYKTESDVVAEALHLLAEHEAEQARRLHDDVMHATAQADRGEFSTLSMSEIREAAYQAFTERSQKDG